MRRLLSALPESFREMDRAAELAGASTWQAWALGVLLEAAALAPAGAKRCVCGHARSEHHQKGHKCDRWYCACRGFKV